MALNRRNFIKLTSVAGGGLLLGLTIPLPADDAPAFEANVYVRFEKDGTIFYRDTKPEMGQGISFGLAMVVCDELGADWSRFVVERPPLSSKIADDHSLASSAGSSGMLAGYLPLRQAAATLRHMLILAASDAWACNPTDCKAEASRVINKITGKTGDFSIFFTAVSKMAVPVNAPLKDDSELTMIGKDLSIPENRHIVSGQQHFAIDIDLPGMVYASIERSPTTDGAVKNVDDSQCRAAKGFLQTVTMPTLRQEASAGNEWQVKFRGSKSGVAVVATSTWAALTARKALQVTWGESRYSGQSTEDVRQDMLDISGRNIRDVARFGDVLEVVKTADNKRLFREKYFNPYQENAQMEPLSAVADYDGETLTLWAGSQSPLQAIGYVAEVTGVPEDKIVFHSMRSGGAFGRRYFYDFIAEAGYLAVKLGKAVKVTWTREDCIQHGRYHLARYDEHALVLDDKNNPVAWDSLTYSASNYGWLGRNIMLDYYAGATPHRATRHAESDSLVLFPGSWRSVDSHPQAFARECFIDEVAVRLGEDPIALRQRWLSLKAQAFPQENIDADRLRRRQEIQHGLLSVLEKAKQSPHWTAPQAPGSGKGVAVSYFYGAYVCQMAFVSLVGSRVRIDKIVCLADCGKIVNPQLVKGQLEGSILWALSALINPAIEIQNGSVVQSNFDDYPVIRMNECPVIEIDLLDSNRPPNRVGESAVPDTTPAVLNAIFNATGNRLRELPIPEEILFRA